MQFSRELASTTIGIPGAADAGNNCHQFTGRRGHAFPVVSHAGGICLEREGTLKTRLRRAVHNLTAATTNLAMSSENRRAGDISPREIERTF